MVLEMQVLTNCTTNDVEYDAQLINFIDVNE